MNEISIYFFEDNELTEFMFQEKEYRTDVIVKIGNNYFNPDVITPHRLMIDFKCMIENVGFYECDPCLILVEDLSKKNIIETILKLNDAGYFLKLKPSTFEIICSNHGDASTNIDDWIRVY